MAKYCKVCGNTINDISFNGDNIGNYSASAIPCGHRIDYSNGLMGLLKDKMHKMMREANEMAKAHGLPPIHKEKDFPV